MAYKRVHERVGKEIPKIYKTTYIYDVIKYNITQITNM